MFLDSMLTNETEIANIPRTLHMMQHTYRVETHLPIIKSISNTDTALLIDQHFVHSCLEGINCNKRFMVTTKVAQLQHYRKSCQKKVETKCEKINHVRDTRIWRHLETVVENMNMALKNIILQ